MCGTYHRQAIIRQAEIGSMGCYFGIKLSPGADCGCFWEMSAPAPPKSSIQITPQLLMMVLLVLLMLALPLTVAAWFLVSHFRESRAVVETPVMQPAIDDTALRQSFESVAATAWADLAKPLEFPLDERMRVPVEDANPADRQSKIIGQIAQLGGTAVVLPPDDQGTHRVLVTLPPGKRDTFLLELTGSRPTTSPAEESVLVEITITRPAQP